jgi:DNA-nicking Smr family endonuclease
MKDVQNAIAYHWSTLSPDAEGFLLSEPNRIDLTKLLQFWSGEEEHKRCCTSDCIGDAMVGSSFYLALNYLRIGKLTEARAMVLNGYFLKQIQTVSMEQLAQIDRERRIVNDEEYFKKTLPYYYTACKAIQSPMTMETFLTNSMTQNYQRMMNFASKAANGPVTEYVELISNDWTHDRHQKTAGKDDECKIRVRLTDEVGKDDREISIGVSCPLKSLFNEYAEERNVSLRSFRFSYQGKTLFLSCAGTKSPSDLGMKGDGTVIVVSQVSSSEETTPRPKESTKSKSSSSKKNKNKKGKSKHKASPPDLHRSESMSREQLKLEHSKILTVLFTEVEPKFKEIRRRLNLLALERTKPKQKRSRVQPQQPVINPSTEGLGSKAGKTQYVVQVGESANLYKTTKAGISSPPLRAITIDLHGQTKAQVQSTLETSLPIWNGIAMASAYPFVIPIQIICGGGNQILSQTVEDWIRSNENVANAPKNLWVPMSNRCPNAA